MLRKVLSVILLVCLLSGLLPALAEDGRIAVSPDSVVLGVGSRKKVTVKLPTADARKAGAVFSSSDESVAVVDKSGNIKGVAEGECVVTVAAKNDSSISAEIPVSVVVLVKKISASAESPSLFIGESTPIVFVCSPENATLQGATYVSSNPKIATVDENGIVTGASRGSTNIVVRSADGNAKTNVKIQVLQQAESITVSPASVSLFIGKSTTLKSAILPKTVSSNKVIWSSDNEAVATVNQSGRVTAVSIGTAVISASANGVSGQTVVTVGQPAKSIVFDSKTVDVLIGSTITLEPTVLPADTSNKAVTYSSANSKIASVDANGVVTGVKGGKTTITATTADGSKHRAKITVRVVVPVEGISFSRKATRVGVGSHTYVTATLFPKDATNKNMTWTVSDPTVATIKGTTNKVRVTGKRWGTVTLTGTTEDGGYTDSIMVNVGSLRKAVTLETLELKSNMEPSIIIKNRSNMTIRNVKISLQAYNVDGEPIVLSGTRGYTLSVIYEPELAPGAKSHHNQFTFQRYNRKHETIWGLEAAIIGWETDDGYFDNNGSLKYSYTIPTKNQEWIQYPKVY